MGYAEPQGPVAPAVAAAGDEAAQPAGVEVGVQVAAAEAPQPAAPDHVAADDRAAHGPAVSGRVPVLEDRLLVVTRSPGLVVARMVEAVVALEAIPAEVRAAQAPARLVVDLLPAVLAHVAEHDPTAVEREPVRVAQAARVDLVLARPADIWVSPRRPVGARAAPVGVDAKELAKQDALVLRVLPRIAGAATIPGADVEPAVGPELELATIVVGEAGMADDDHPAARALPGVAVGAGAKLVDLDVPRAVRVVGVEQPVAAIVGVEGDGEQAALAPRRDSSAYVEERLAPPVPVVEHPDRAARLDHVQMVREARGLGDVGRRREAADPALADPAVPVADPQIADGVGAPPGTRRSRRQRQGERQERSSRE